MFRLRHVPLVLRAISRWLIGSRSGRKLSLSLVAVVVAWRVLAGGESLGTRSGKWTGLHNNYAPNEGVITLSGGYGRSLACSVRGRAGHTSGNGWVFRGDASVDSTSCEGRVDWRGNVSAQLKLRMAWNGSVKGIGGDWEDVSGHATCEGELAGTMADGGEWTGRCKGEDSEWGVSFRWKLTGG